MFRLFNNSYKALNKFNLHAVRYIDIIYETFCNKFYGTCQKEQKFSSLEHRKYL